MREEAIYARQSVDKKDSVSIEAQIEGCRAIAKSKHPKIYKDKGYSGKNTERPDLQNLIEEIKQGKISAVYVYKLDRISRNISDFYKLYELMQEYDTGFISLNERFDTTTTMGRAMMGIIAVFAQMERETIQQRVKDNYYYRIRDGRWAGGPAPYGYRNARTEDNVPTLVIDEREMEVVKIAYMFYNGTDTLSLTAISNQLFEDGFTNRRGQRFTTATISKMLQNPVYTQADAQLYKYFQTKKARFLNDEAEWDGTRAACIVGKKRGKQLIRNYEDLREQTIYLVNVQPVIPSSFYISIQDRLEKNETFRGSGNDFAALEELSGKLKCAKCGYAIKAYSKSTNLRPYLNCHGRTTLRICNERYNGVNFYELQTAVGKEIGEFIDNIIVKETKIREENVRLKEEAEKLDKELKNLIDIAARGELTADALQEAIELRQQKVYELELQIQKNDTASRLLGVQLYNNADLGFYHEFEIPFDYEALQTHQRRALVKLLVNKIYLKSDGTFNIKWNI